MASSSEGNALQEQLHTLHDRETTTVLHVDDEPEFADLVSIYLERAGDLEVVTEASAEDGLERLETETIDCVVSDYDMPETDGLAFLHAVRERYPDLPFILFTGKGSEEIASEAISAGVTDYVQKEQGTDQYAVLANRIENAVQQYHAETEIERGFSAIETAREGIAFLDEEGTFLYANQAYAETYGYDRGEMVGEHWELIYPEEGVSQVYEEILPSVPANGAWSGENVHERKDGTQLVVSHALTYSSDGTLLCLIRDITAEKETERELQRTRRHFEQFVDAVEEYAIFSLDTEGFVTSWNDGAERLEGYSEAEILGEHVSTFYPEARTEAGDPTELLETAVADGSVDDEGWRVRADGSEFWAQTLLTAVFDDDGQHQGYLNVTRDATDRKAATRALESDEELLDEALDVLDDVFYMLDAEGNIVRVTDRAAEVTGYSRSELLSMSPLELFVPEDRTEVERDIQTALETGSATIDATLQTEAGERIPFEFRKRRFVDEEGTPFAVGIGRDVSERERRERQLQRQLQQFEHFGSVVSHDLRTPLDTAMGRLELARETGEEEHLDAMATALDRLNELIGDLSSVMREGELISDIESVELGPPLRSVWEALETGDATLTVETDARIRADEDALKRIVENLFKNSVEHGSTGSRPQADDAIEHAGPDVDLTVGSLPDGFYVEDDGPGISEGERERIFEAGYSTRGGSHGFGLASVRQLVVAHGWDITATAGTDGGARFEITDVDVENGE